MKEYVIVGNGVAAVGCIEGIRSVDKKGGITVLSAEPYPTYCRPLISYYLQGKTDRTKMQYRGESFCEDNGCQVLYGASATVINPTEQTVCTAAEQSFSYNKLCVCTGSSPFVPPMEGLNQVKNRFSFMTVDDMLALEKAITPKSRVLIIGAGLIGLKCAEGILGKVADITVCDLADRVLSSILEKDSADLVMHHLEGLGITFSLSDSVAEFCGNSARLQSGKTVDFDILVTAVGVRANTGLIRDAGGACGRGITVDEKMQTSLAGIFAAGDCTESVDISDGVCKIMAIMPNAYSQGYTAGVNMAGGKATFDCAVPMNSIGFAGLHIMTAGSRQGTVFARENGSFQKKFYVRDGRLVGFELIGNVERAGIYLSLIRNRTDLDSLDFEALIKSPDFSHFDEKIRSKFLGGVV